MSTAFPVSQDPVGRKSNVYGQRNVLASEKATLEQEESYNILFVARPEITKDAKMRIVAYDIVPIHKTSSQNGPKLTQQNYW